jgi:hypothetical protein
VPVLRPLRAAAALREPKLVSAPCATAGPWGDVSWASSRDRRLRRTACPGRPRQSGVSHGSPSRRFTTPANRQVRPAYSRRNASTWPALAGPAFPSVPKSAPAAEAAAMLPRQPPADAGSCRRPRAGRRSGLLSGQRPCAARATPDRGVRRSAVSGRRRYGCLSFRSRRSSFACHQPKLAPRFQTGCPPFFLLPDRSPEAF